MKHAKQMSFFKPQNKFFGGSLLVGRRKSRRPLDSKQAIHVVIKSSWATGAHRFTEPANQRTIEKLLATISKRTDVQLYRYAIVSNHIHMVIRAKRRHHYVRFISSLTGRIASVVMGHQSFREFTLSKLGALGAFRGEGSKGSTSNGFFDHRPFTRVLSWGRDYVNTLAYLLQNKLEALGFIKQEPRTNYYARWMQQNASG